MTRVRTGATRDDLIGPAARREGALAATVSVAPAAPGTLLDARMAAPAVVVGALAVVVASAAHGVPARDLVVAIPRATAAARPDVRRALPAPPGRVGTRALGLSGTTVGSVGVVRSVGIGMTVLSAGIGPVARAVAPDGVVSVRATAPLGGPRLALVGLLALDPGARRDPRPHVREATRGRAPGRPAQDETARSRKGEASTTAAAGGPRTPGQPARIGTTVTASVAAEAPVTVRSRRPSFPAHPFPVRSPASNSIRRYAANSAP